MARVREIAMNPLPRSNDQDVTSRVDSPLDQRSAIQLAKGREANDLAALMACPPGEEPAPSQDDLYPIREVLQDAIEEVLDDRERFIFDAVVVERVSYRKLAERMALAKSYLHRIQKASCQKLAEYLTATNPELKARFT